MNDKQKREIRSFVRREGRITAAQQRALDEWYAKYGIELGVDYLDWQMVFANQQPVTLEIGFGNGEALAQMARAEPEQSFVGIEVHRPGVGRLLATLEREGIHNVRVICADAAQVLKQNIPNQSLNRIHIFFPDPWPKKRHHKRRLVTSTFTNLLVTKLQPGGIIHLATDWEDYAQEMLSILQAHPELTNTTTGFSLRPSNRPITHFEKRGTRLGHQALDLKFYRSIR